jgi:hypothetical protein
MTSTSTSTNLGWRIGTDPRRPCPRRSPPPLRRRDKVRPITGATDRLPRIGCIVASTRRSTRSPNSTTAQHRRLPPGHPPRRSAGALPNPDSPATDLLSRTVGLETCQLSEPDLAKQHDGIARTYGFELSETVLRADSTSRCSCSNGLRRIRTVQPDGELRVETVLNTLAAPQVDYHRSKLPSRRRRRRRRRRHNLLAASVSLSHLCRLYPVLTVLRYATLGP